MVIEISDENTTKGRYAVQDIEYDKLGVTHIVIINTKTKKVVLDQYRKDIGKGAKVPPQAQKEPKNDTLDNKAGVSMKDINASVTTMEEEYVSPFDSEDLKFIKEYYNKLEEDRKEKFSIWLFTEVQETKVDKLSDEQAQIIASKLKKKLAKDLEKKAEGK